MLIAFLNPLLDWIRDHPWVGYGLIGVSVVSVLLAVIVLPWIVVRLPADYFAHERPPQLPWQQMHPVLRALAIGAKNLFGAVLVVLGIIMIFTPGQGLLALLAGLALLDLPGKRRAERWLVSRPTIFGALNGLREKHGKPPLERPRL